MYIILNKALYDLELSFIYFNFFLKAKSIFLFNHCLSLPVPMTNRVGPGRSREQRIEFVSSVRWNYPTTAASSASSENRHQQEV